jgi:hypothetical protein
VQPGAIVTSKLESGYVRTPVTDSEKGPVILTWKATFLCNHSPQVWVRCSDSLWMNELNIAKVIPYN